MLEARRFPNGVECRAAVKIRASGRKLESMAATFGTPAEIGGFTETIRAGAFRASLAAGADILALVDHDPGRLLARTGSGTLRLSEDSRGLAFSLDVPDTQLGRDVLTMVERRDLGGMSFGFRVKDEAWPARDTRELRAIELIETSIVHAHPAYGQTSISARARAMGQHEAAAHIRRLRLLKLQPWPCSPVPGPSRRGVSLSWPRRWNAATPARSRSPVTGGVPCPGLGSAGAVRSTPPPRRAWPRSRRP